MIWLLENHLLGVLQLPPQEPPPSILMGTLNRVMAKTRRPVDTTQVCIAAWPICLAANGYRARLTVPNVLKIFIIVMKVYR